MKYIFFFALALSSLTLFAQTKSYMNKSGQIVSDIKDADSYIILTKQSDTAYVVQQFDLKDTIINYVTFKDKELSVLHGKSVYFEKKNYKNVKYTGNVRPAFFDDTLNRIKTTAYFKDGLKDGEWKDYSYDGSISKISNYKSDILDGKYVNYDIDSHTILSEGFYKNDVKDGEWHLLDVHGNIITNDLFKNGKKIKSSTVPSPYRDPELTKEFISYIKKTVVNFVKNDDKYTIYISCKLSKDGKLLEAHFVETKSISESLQTNINNLVANAPVLKPAYDSKLKSNIETTALIKIDIDRKDVDVKYIGYGEKMRYQLTH